MAGAAPNTTTKVMAVSLKWKSRMASGNQAIVGIVCRPVISEPIAARSTLTRATATPSNEPITTARPKPMPARRIVYQVAFTSLPLPMSSNSRWKTGTGPGST